MNRAKRLIVFNDGTTQIVTGHLYTFYFKIFVPCFLYRQNGKCYCCIDYLGSLIMPRSFNFGNHNFQVLINAIENDSYYRKLTPMEWYTKMNARYQQILKVNPDFKQLD